MATTFEGLVKLADFKTSRAKISNKPKLTTPQKQEEHSKENEVRKEIKETKKEIKLGGLVYNIQLILPETRDTKVYDALFKSLREHIL